VKYRTAAAFRRALEDRLRERSIETNVPLVRLRKMIAFDRFLARIARRVEEAWIIKGGFALQLRLGAAARTTKDIDASVAQQLRPEQALAHLRKTAEIAQVDWFEFEIGEPVEAATGAPKGGLRFPVRSLLDGRTFESFQLDLGQGDAILEEPEMLACPALLAFADIEPATVPCYPLTTQVAEKLHALSRPYARGESSRVRDLVDILLIASMGSLDVSRLARALAATFKARGTHDPPKALPRSPRNWAGPYSKLAHELKLRWPNIDEAWQAACEFLNPVLEGRAAGKWNRASWRWEPQS